jgi:esterase/lipase
VHGLLDSPFTFREIANYLQKHDIVCKSILLPGHGTKPEDLLSISYQEWIEALHYGVENLRKEVENLFIVGYSTGATLSIFQALKDNLIAGIILLSPAVQIKIPMFIINAYAYFKTKLHCRYSKWINKVKEIDYAKYRSIPFNAVKQVETLTQIIKNIRQHHTINCPLFMCLSYEDETTSSGEAINFFSSYNHQQSKLVLYSKINQHYPDKRIMTRTTHYPHLQVSQFSHISIPFSLHNPHYGLHGDFLHASRMGNKNFLYGAYDLGNINVYDLLYKLKLINKQWRGLTYNPDFSFMMEEIIQFIKT